MKRDLYTFFVGTVALGVFALFLFDSTIAQGTDNTDIDADNSSNGKSTVPSVTTSILTSTKPSATNTTTTVSPNTTTTVSPNTTTAVSPNTTISSTTTKQSSSTSPSRTTSHVLTTISTSSTAAAPTTPPQHFDAASFIGGIILCAGVIAIVFFGCKFYKARTSPTFARY